MELISLLQPQAKQNSEREVVPPEHTTSPTTLQLSLEGVAEGEEAVEGRRKLNPIKTHRAFHHHNHCTERQCQQWEQGTELRSDNPVMP